MEGVRIGFHTPLPSRHFRTTSPLYLTHAFGCGSAALCLFAAIPLRPLLHLRPEFRQMELAFGLELHE
jgi:hypothetical protein